MTQKLIPAESSESIAAVWQKLSEAEQRSAIDLISNIICDYYFSQRKGEKCCESECGEQDQTIPSSAESHSLHQAIHTDAGKGEHRKYQTAI